MEASCFEMLFFKALQRRYTARKDKISYRDEVKDSAGGLVKRLGFAMRIEWSIRTCALCTGD